MFLKVCYAVLSLEGCKLIKGSSLTGSTSSSTIKVYDNDENRDFWWNEFVNKWLSVFEKKMETLVKKFKEFRFKIVWV